MIDLTSAQHSLLKEVISSGSSGLKLDVTEASRRMGDLMFLALSDLVDVTEDRRVVATARGRAFALRGAA